MRVIHKFELDIVDSQTIALDWDAQILSVQEQHGKVSLWALVNTENGKGNRIIRIIGTGHPITEGEELEYLGTVQQMHGALVWHVFEKHY